MSLTTLRNETERMSTLLDYELLDTLPESAFDEIVARAAKLLQSPVAAFTLVDNDRVWLKARVGIEAEEVSAQSLFCACAISNDAPLIVSDAAADGRFANSDLVAQAPFIRFYAGTPVHARNGHALGSLCVLDTVPRQLTDRDREVLESLGREVEVNVELRRQLKEKQDLLFEQATLNDLILRGADSIVETLRIGRRILSSDATASAPDSGASTRESPERIRHKAELIDAVEVNPCAFELSKWWRYFIRKAQRRADLRDLAVREFSQLPAGNFHSDHALLERILNYLLTFAVGAARSGSEILLEARVEGGTNLHLSVSDDGLRNAGYNAPGLLACERLAAALGGRIVVGDRQPQGTKAELIVPAAGPTEHV